MKMMLVCSFLWWDERVLGEVVVLVLGKTYAPSIYRLNLCLD